MGKTGRIALIVAAIVAVVVGIVLVRRGQDQRASAADGGTNDDSPASTTAGPALTAPNAATLPRGSIAGRVTGEGGKLVPGASVCVFASSNKLASALTDRPTCVPVGADGRYRIEELAPASYRVTASAPQRAPANWRDADRDESMVLLASGAKREGIDLVLASEGVLVRGHVKDIAGGPIAGAFVSVTVGQFFSPDGSSVATSDGSGAFELWTKAGPVHASAIADGYNEGKKDGMAPGQLIEIELTPESVLQGRVVEAGTDTPVPDARVTAEAESAMPFGGPGGAGRSAMSDADGRFRIRGLAPGRYRTKALALHRWGTAPESTMLGLAETSRVVVVELHEALAITGRVVRDGNKPAVDCAVWVTEKNANRTASGRSDEDGNVHIDGLFAGTYAPNVRCPQLASEERYDPIVIGATAVKGLVWKVSGGLEVRGVVVDSTKKPVPRANLTMRTSTKGADPRAAQRWSEAQAKDDGTFHVRGLARGTYQLEAHGDGVTPMADPLEVKVDGDVANLEVVLPAGGRIEGTVVDESGGPIAAVEVRLRGDRYDWRADRITTKDDGTFAFSNVRAGDYNVLAEDVAGARAARAPGSKDDDVQGAFITVTAGKTASTRLTVESQKGEIRGKVTTEDGDVVTDAFVEAQRESDSAGAVAGQARREMRWRQQSGDRSVLVDTDGSFTIKKLAPGNYTVCAFKKGGGEAAVENVKVGANVTITIRSEGSLSGTIKVTQGAVPERFTIGAVDERTGLRRSEQPFRTNGRWSVRDLPAGQYIVSAEAPEGRASATVTLGKGENKDGVELTLEPRATVKGRIVSLEGGTPVAGISVFVTPAKGDITNVMFGTDDRRFITDAEGRFEIEGAAPGKSTVLAFSRDGDWAPIFYPMKIEPGRPTEVPTLRAAKARVKGQLGGDLGFVTQGWDPSSGYEVGPITIKAVRPASAGARAGLAAGDVIVSVDGHDVTGSNGYLYSALSRVPADTKLTLGLAKGGTVELVADKPGLPPGATPKKM